MTKPGLDLDDLHCLQRIRARMGNKCPVCGRCQKADVTTISDDTPLSRHIPTVPVPTGNRLTDTHYE
jgi:hypothetical protein